VLIDHAHCERKAAGVALQLMFRYPSRCRPGAGALSPLAREELEHFELVLQVLERARHRPAAPAGPGLWSHA
jgi:tRNA-(ms[2]io[6]A)-hydroxylase